MSLTRASAFVFLTLSLPGHWQTTDAAECGDIDSLVERHVAWRGGEQALQELQHLSLHGRLNTAGLEGSIELSAGRGGYIRQRYQLGPLKGLEVVSPVDAWVRNMSGQIEGMGQASRTILLRTYEDLFALWFLDPDARKSATCMGREEKDGQDYTVLRIMHDNADESDVFLREDGRMDWLRATEDTETVWYRYSDWREIDGIRFAHSQQTLFTQKEKNSDIRWDRIETGNALVPTSYRRPSASNSLGSIDGDTTTGPLSMELYLDGYVFLPALVNGNPTSGVLDSGAGITVLDKGFAERVGIEGEGSLQASGVAGSVEANLASGVDIGIGQLHLRDLTVAILDLSPISSALGHPLDLILGKEVFNNFIVDIDYPGRRIAFHDPIAFDYRGSGSTLLLDAGDDGHKLVQLSINGMPPITVTLDSGSGQTLSLFKSYWESSGLLDGREPVSTILTGGVGGRSVSRVATLERIRIGDHELHSVPVEFHNSAAGAFNTKRLEGNLGAGILSRFRNIFDYHRGRLHLEASGKSDGDFQRDRLGLQLERDGGRYVVIHVAEGSPAQHAGYREGDIVTAINGVPIAEAYPQKWRGMVRGEHGNEVTLSDASAQPRRVQLKSYY